MLYLWIKAFHLVAAISWMAALLYLPRLMVYHTAAETGSKQSEAFKLMERRLLRFIAHPALVATWASGLWMIAEGGHIQAGWMQAKLALLLVLTGVHGLNAGWVRDFAADRNRRSATFYRIVNEVPTLLMIGIVVLAVVRPF